MARPHFQMLTGLLSPSILLDRTMRVKITDFGTAKLLKKEEMADGHPLDGERG